MRTDEFVKTENERAKSLIKELEELTKYTQKIKYLKLERDF